MTEIDQPEPTLADVLNSAWATTFANSSAPKEAQPKRVKLKRIKSGGYHPVEVIRDKEWFGDALWLLFCRMFTREYVADYRMAGICNILTSRAAMRKITDEAKLQTRHPKFRSAKHCADALELFLWEKMEAGGFAEAKAQAFRWLEWLWDNNREWIIKLAWSQCPAELRAAMKAGSILKPSDLPALPKTNGVMKTLRQWYPQTKF